jgi:ubiquinone/menaquinone biosynthesis C-methylase UbiE
MNKNPVQKKITKKVESKKPIVTSWGGVATWYDKHLEKSKDTYHEKVIYPNLARLLGDVKGKHLLDLACGQGQLSRLLADAGAYVLGVDIGKELIDIAEKKNKDYKFKIHYFTTSTDDLYMIKDASQDMVVCVLALQNIERLQDTMKEISRVLTKTGTFVCVMNHPAFRIPKGSAWGFDEAENSQFRRIDTYLTESRVKIDMTPGSLKDKKFTVSFHRPLQVYMKAFAKHGLAITRIEEWSSHKESEKGPKQHAEDKARKEIPMFMCVELNKIELLK